jgi:uncharacterized protein YndB with AHSA1/START domain
MSFDFAGVYDHVKELEAIDYTLGDERKVSIKFIQTGGGVLVTESFEAEGTHPEEMQRGGWQAILDNFKKYAEANT